MNRYGTAGSRAGRAIVAAARMAVVFGLLIVLLAGIELVGARTVVLAANVVIRSMGTPPASGQRFIDSAPALGAAGTSRPVAQYRG